MIVTIDINDNTTICSSKEQMINQVVCNSNETFYVFPPDAKRISINDIMNRYDISFFCSISTRKYENFISTFRWFINMFIETHKNNETFNGFIVTSDFQFDHKGIRAFDLELQRTKNIKLIFWFCSTQKEGIFSFKIKRLQLEKWDMALYFCINPI